MNREKIIENLVRLRKDRNLMQKDVAQALGVSDKTYSKWETGETEPGLENLRRLAEYYGVAPAAFFAEGAPEGTLRRELLALSPQEGTLRCHEWMSEMYDALYENVWQLVEKTRQFPEEPVPVPENPEICGSSFSELPGGALFLRHRGDDANFHLLLMPSKEDYGWIGPEAEGLAAFFALLQRPKLLALLLVFEKEGKRVLHSTEYLASQAGLSLEETRRALEELTRWGLCSHEPAETGEGRRELWSSGETRILRAILTLAHLMMDRPPAKEKREGGEEA